MKTNKRAFTLMELMVAMIVSGILLTLLFGLLSRTYKIYNEATSNRGENNYKITMLSDIETLSRGCDYVTTNSSGNVLIIHDGSNSFVVEAGDYSVDAVFSVDNNSKTIQVDIGGDLFCIMYVQNTPS